MSNRTGQIEVAEELSEGLTIHRNLDQEVVVTTVDKVKLCLMENEKALSARREWITPLTVFVTLVTTFAATSFKDALLQAATWRAIYIIGLFTSLVWLIHAAYQAWENRNRAGIQAILRKLKAHDVINAEEA